MPYRLDEQKCRNLELASRREWILTNGLGGFAMGTIAGVNARRYHGHLVAAIRPPVDRMVLLASIEAYVQVSGNPIGISTNQYAGAIHPEGYHYLEGFEIGKRAVWRFKVTGAQVEKSLVAHPGKNAVTVRYANVGERRFSLNLKPLVCHKPFHENFVESGSYPQALAFPKDSTLVEHDGLVLVLSHAGAKRLPVQGWYYRFEYAREVERGLNPRDDLFCPCELSYELHPGEEAVIVASLGDMEDPYLPEEEPDPGRQLSAMLRRSAEMFFVDAPGRKTIIAGYPWFGDWGRDTMISIPGLCLYTGKESTAREIIGSYIDQMRDGLIPNRFAEDGEHSDYNTVDATLWMANAAYLTLVAEWDEPFARKCFAAFQEVFRTHQEGTSFGIKVDPADGLLSQGAEGVQLTWMDAKVGDWVVTPRHGKPVEVNGLWINALRVFEWLADKLGQEASEFKMAAEKAENNFDAKFFAPMLGHYLDTCDPDDASLRPNQVIAMSLPFAPAKGPHAKEALQKVSSELLTPMGLRTLGPREPAYRGRFTGPIQELDAAYHQGTVWPWLLGPYCSALTKLFGDRAEVRQVLRMCREVLFEYGIGGVAEVYDGDEPQLPGGCPWQAWSVAELLRACFEDGGGNV